MGARNRVGIGLSYHRPAKLHRLAELILWNRFLGSLILKNTVSVVFLLWFLYQLNLDSLLFCFCMILISQAHISMIQFFCIFLCLLSFLSFLLHKYLSHIFFPFRRSFPFLPISSLTCKMFLLSLHFRVSK
jgi:hypothetical protein